MNWIPHPVILEDDKIKLVPLDDQYFDELIAISTDKKIWEFLSIHGWQKDELLIALKSAKLKRLSGEEYPFVIIDKIKNRVIGCTRYMDIVPQFKKLEIGWTWYDPAYWGTSCNTACKLLLLTYAFETLNCIRVQLSARDTNLRSRAAIEKIGGRFEGILRNHMIRFEVVRNTAMYSIIDSEWPETKQILKGKVAAI